MNKHSPGPWEYAAKLTASETHRGYFIRADKPARNGKWALADVQPGDEDGNLGRANARLIAAAPNLLAAAHKAKAALSELLMSRDPVVYAEALRELDDAIVKAEGDA